MEPSHRQAEAAALTERYFRPLYGFVLRRTASPEDAEDLVQEICLKVYRALCVRENLRSVDAFVWTAARHVLANHYRDKARQVSGFAPEDRLEALPDGAPSPEEQAARREEEIRLRTEIAHLSKIQRQIVILYYYEGLKQQEIAQRLGIPAGTVKWRLSTARQDLKKGMRKMRPCSELKFHPIELICLGTNGSVGAKGNTGDFLRSPLAQNIVYCVHFRAKTLEEIADALGVSPVYVEAEADYLTEYGFLLRQGNRYLSNTLIDEATPESVAMHRELYGQAARLMAGPLFDALLETPLLSQPELTYPDGDRNFLMWALAFHVLAWSGESLIDNTVSFEEAAVLRPDGGQYIATAAVKDEAGVYRYADQLDGWFGPCWNGNEEGVLLWQLDSPWSLKRVDGVYPQRIGRCLPLLSRFASGGTLSPDETAFLLEQGFLRREKDGLSLNLVRIRGKALHQQLLHVGEQVKAACWPRLVPLRETYARLVLSMTPPQLQKMQRYCLQHLFFSDGWLMVYAAREWLDSGRLRPPSPEQRASLTTLLLTP